MKKQLAWIFGGGSVMALAVLAAGGMGGCSTNNGGKDSGPDVANQVDEGTDTTVDVANDVAQDAAPDCKVVKGPFEVDSGVYCPFQGDGSTFGNCPNATDHCCDPKNGNSTCTASGTACNFDGGKGADFTCNQSSHCTNNQICCLDAPGKLGGPDPGCSYFFVSGNVGTSCMASCGAQPQICGQDSDCTGGKTCKPVSTLAMWLGVCQ